MDLLLAFASAVVYGCADFLGGRATRLASSAVVTFWSQLGGLVVLGVAVVLVDSDGPTARALGFGALGGLAGALGILLLYHGLAVGTMSIVSPVTAVTAATIPVLFGMVFLHERPGAWSTVGIGAALLAITLVSLSGNASSDRPNAVSAARTAAIAVGAGTGFGLFFVCLERAGDPESIGLWALVGARPVSIAAAGLVAWRAMRRISHPGDEQSIATTDGIGMPRTRSGWNVGRAALPLVVAAGLLDQLANVLYVLSLGDGLLSVLAVLASLYPLSTVLLARFIDHERLNRIQLVGMLLAFGGLVLMAL